MIIVKHQQELKEYLDKQRAQGRSIGFVPTMGALHKGHISLVTTSAERTDITVCSIFVNPTQFNDVNDFNKYPQKPENDIRMLEASPAAILFTPAVKDVYSSGITSLEKYELGSLETILEGKYRPGHFQGVCQVMHRLLAIVQPDLLFMGQKDYQQCMVVERLIRLKGLPVKLIRCPTLREEDGLAMSSRNLRLSSAERLVAPAIFTALNTMKQNLKKGNMKELKQQAAALLQIKGFRVDYIETADAGTLELLSEWDGETPVVALTAAFLGEVRLIDNMVLT